ACVIECVPVHVTDASGANVAGIAGLQLKLTNAGVSVTDTPLNSTEERRVAMVEYVITSPTALQVNGDACLAISRCGVGLTSTVLLARGAVVVAVVDETQAVAPNCAALRSACVIACVPVQVTDAVGANVAGIAGLQLKLTNAGVSVTDTPFN